MMILHVATETEWNACANFDYYAPVAFKLEGYIHACSDEQLAGVLNRYFKGKEDLILLYIDEQLLTVPVKYESGTAGELFPHIYGRINKTAIVKRTVCNQE